MEIMAKTVKRPSHIKKFPVAEFTGGFRLLLPRCLSGRLGDVCELTGNLPETGMLASP